MQERLYADNLLSVMQLFNVLDDNGQQYIMRRMRKLWERQRKGDKRNEKKK